MLRKMIFVFLLLTFLAGCFFAGDALIPDNAGEEKTAALKEWQRIERRADFHNGALRKMRKIILKADANVPALTEISRLIAEVPFHTEPLLHVAEQAALAKNKEIDFLEIAELAIIKLSESKLVEDLADYASSLSPGDDLSLYRQKYQSLRNSTEANTISEAVDMVNEMIREAEKAASSL